MPNTTFNCYVNFHAAKQQVCDLTPLDYFFAKEVVISLIEHHQDSARIELSGKQQLLLFHLSVLLNQYLQAGHSCLPINTVAEQWVGKACDDDGVISHQGFVFPSEQEITLLLAELGIAPTDNQLVVYSKNRLYLRRYFSFENELADKISTLNSSADFSDVGAIKHCLNVVFPELDGQLESSNEIDWQKVAVANAINKGFSIIAGGPGTGKTYTVTKLLAAMVMLAGQSKATSKLPKIALVAPTGKAAQRLAESITAAVNNFRGQLDDKVLDEIPVNAQTIHRLLGVIPYSPNFKHHQDNPLPYDVLLIDEVSMVDLAMMTRIFRALKPATKVIMLGDADQLPSVAAGSVLADLAVRPHLGFSQENLTYLQQVTGDKVLPKAKKLSADHLTILLKSRRFDGEGAIGKLASWVITGQTDVSWQFLQDHQKPAAKQLIDNQELALITENNLTWLDRYIETYFVPLFSCQSLAQITSSFAKFRVLSAVRNGNEGIEYLNQYIEEYLLHKGLLNRTSGQLYHGQPVMICENDYQLNLYNGDIGFIWKNESGQLMAMFEQLGEFKSILPSRLPKFEPVYAMTIHKTQGSEFEHVAMVLPSSGDNKLLSRELLYTGITRAKARITIATNESVWRKAVSLKVERYSSLTL